MRQERAHNFNNNEFLFTLVLCGIVKAKELPLSLHEFQTDE